MDIALACPRCGAAVSGTRFCTGCGTPLAHAESSGAGVGGAVRSQGWPATDGVVVTSEFPAAASLQTATAVLGPAPHDLVPAPVAPAWVAGGAAAAPAARGRVSILALLTVAALALSGWVLMHGVERHILTGTVTIVDSTYSGSLPGTSCTGRGGYSDIGTGAQVVLSDGSGSTLSTGRLSPGRFDGLGCVFSFELDGVRHTDFYVLAVAGRNRGELQYSYDELAGQDWSLQLSLGVE